LTDGWMRGWTDGWDLGVEGDIRGGGSIVINSATWTSSRLSYRHPTWARLMS